MTRSTPGSGIECCCENNVRYEKINCFVNVKVYLKISASVSVSDRIHSFTWPLLYITITNSPVGCAFGGSNECAASALCLCFYL